MSYKYKLKNIKAFVFDIDGVFTDGTIMLMPDGSMTRSMSVLDGFAVQHALKKKYPIAIITGGNDSMVKQRLEYLGLSDIYMRSHHKIEAYDDFKAKYQLEDAAILYMGDDVPDIEVMLKVGLPSCPINAVPEVKKVSQYVSPIAGGSGCVRDVIEQVLKLQGNWATDTETQSV